MAQERAEDGSGEKISPFPRQGNRANVLEILETKLQKNYYRISILGNLATLLVACFIAYQLFDYNRERMVETMDKKHKEFNSIVMCHIRSESITKLDEKKFDNNYTMWVLNFLEKLSVEHNKGLITAKDVSDYFPGFLDFWYTYKDWIEQYRVKIGDKTTYENFQNLAKVIEEKKYLPMPKERDLAVFKDMEKGGYRFKLAVAKAIIQEDTCLHW